MGDNQPIQLTRAQYNELLEMCKTAERSSGRDFEQPSGLNRGMQRKFKEFDTSNKWFYKFNDYIESKAPKKPDGSVDVDADMSTRRTFEALGEFRRHLDIVYSALLAAGRADVEQHQMFEAYYDLMEVHVKAPHNDYVENKKRLIDLQDKQYRSALADVKDRAEKQSGAKRGYQGQGQGQGGSGFKRFDNHKGQGQQQPPPPPPQQQQQQYNKGGQGGKQQQRY